MQEEQPTYERLGAKRLGLPDVIAQSVGFMGPVFSAAFVIPLVVGVISASGKGGGTATPLSVLIAGVGVFALGWLIARYARQIHSAGSLYDYVSRGLGERIGVAAGWLYYMGVIMLTMALYLLAGGYIQSTLASEFSVNPMPPWAWTLILMAVLFAVLYFGVRISTRAQLMLAGISLLVVLGFFIMVIVKLGHANSVLPFKPSSSADGYSGIFFGVLYGVLMFTGFRDGRQFGRGDGEAEPPRCRSRSWRRRASRRRGTCSRPTSKSPGTITASRPSPPRPEPRCSRSAHRRAPAGTGERGSTDCWRLYVVLFDMMAVGVGCAVSASRGIFAMARDRRIPAPLAKVSKRYETPLGAICFVVGAVGVAVILDQFAPSLFALPQTPHYFALFAWGSTFGGFALVVVYLLMAVGSIRSFARAQGRFLIFFAALVGIAITGGAIYGSFYKVTSPTIVAPWCALIWLAVGLIVAFASKGRTQASMHLPDLAGQRIWLAPGRLQWATQVAALSRRAV